MDRIEIIQMQPLMPMIERGIEAAFTVHRLWQVPDPDRFLAEVGPRVRGIAVGAHGRVDAALVDRLPNLELVSNFGVGYDTVDAAYCGKRNILVTNTPDVLTEEVADTALGLILMTVRELGAAERWVRDGLWLEKGNYPLTGGTLRGAKVGIVALGRIGKAIARRLEAFGCPVAYHNRSRAADVDYRYYPNLVEMARDVDILVSVAPGGAATRHLINAEVLAALGAKGTLINIGRGSVVDEAALVAALEAGTIWAAGLDVFETEPCWPKALMAHPRSVVLPHVGSASVHTRDLMGQLVVDNLTRWFDKGEPITPVPETPWPRR
jgi:lactate dehydrogenase-like 2-hydroxyacid dehydrogenase